MLHLDRCDWLLLYSMTSCSTQAKIHKPHTIYLETNFSLMRFYQPEGRLHSVSTCNYRAYALTCQAAMRIYWNKGKCLHKRVEHPQNWIGTRTRPPFHRFWTPIWQSWRHLHTLYKPLNFFLYNVIPPCFRANIPITFLKLAFYLVVEFPF